jgi:hypothetical protein
MPRVEELRASIAFFGKAGRSFHANGFNDGWLDSIMFTRKVAKSSWPDDLVAL